MVISDGIPAVPRNRNFRYSVPNPSAEEKTTRNSVPWNKNRSKLLEFRSEPFRGRKNNSEKTRQRKISKKWQKDDFWGTDLRVHTEWQPPLSGIYSIMMEKLAQACEGGGGGARQPSFHYIYHHVQSCSLRSNRVGRYSHPISSLTKDK